VVDGRQDTLLLSMNRLLLILLAPLLAAAQPLPILPASAMGEANDAPELPATFQRAPSWVTVSWATGYRVGVSNVSTNMMGSRPATATNAMLPVVAGDNWVMWTPTNSTNSKAVMTNWTFTISTFAKMSMTAEGWLASTTTAGINITTNQNVFNELRRVWKHDVTNETPLRFTLAATSSSVTLGWNASTNVSVVGYNLYWGTASRAYAGHKPVPVPLTATTLTNLMPGTNYFFAVTAKNGVGLESGYSAEVSYQP
jgi:hypothetical protein